MSNIITNLSGEESIEFAMKHCSIDDDLRATEATLADWQENVTNSEEDLKDSSLLGDTRAILY